MPDQSQLTERQQAWFASLREGLERDTGRTVEQWVEIARACPEVKPRARLAWMKTEHGLGQNRASLVFRAAFPGESSWSEPAAIEDTLWSDASARAIFAALRMTLLAIPDVIVGQRKGFTGFSRRFQFAAAKPAGRDLILGLAVDPAMHPLLGPSLRSGWSERLTAQARIAAPAEIATFADAFRAAWDAS